MFTRDDGGGRLGFSSERRVLGLEVLGWGEGGWLVGNVKSTRAVWDGRCSPDNTLG